MADLPPNSFTQISGNFPANGVCAIAEQALVVPSALAKLGCHWETSYPDGTTFTPAASGPLTILNRWLCKESAAPPCCVPDWTSVPASSHNDPVIIAACSAAPQGQCVSNAAIHCFWNSQDPRCSTAGKDCPGFPAGGAKDRCKQPCQWNPLNDPKCTGENPTGTGAH
ncbi:MAG: hypothetical protein NTX64_01295 [Elusimicrobia bacterium]|nr:hypothetical protein [Elusimicrobiota bacterium]